MADVPKIEEILREAKSLDGVKDVVLVSRSGMYIAGDVPKGVHTETFVAMFAILLGAAETATSELKERLNSVVVNLDDFKVVVVLNGPKALFVVRVEKQLDVERLKQELGRYSTKIEQYL